MTIDQIMQRLERHAAAGPALFSISQEDAARIVEHVRALKAALKPFSDKIVDVGEDEADDDHFSNARSPYNQAVSVKVCDIRRAAALVRGVITVSTPMGGDGFARRWEHAQDATPREHVEGWKTDPWGPPMPPPPANGYPAFRPVSEELADYEHVAGQYDDLCAPRYRKDDAKPGVVYEAKGEDVLRQARGPYRHLGFLLDDADFVQAPTADQRRFAVRDRIAPIDEPPPPANGYPAFAIDFSELEERVAAALSEKPDVVDYGTHRIRFAREE